MKRQDDTEILHFKPKINPPKLDFAFKISYLCIRKENVVSLIIKHSFPSHKTTTSN